MSRRRGDWIEFQDWTVRTLKKTKPTTTKATIKLTPKPAARPIRSRPPGPVAMDGELGRLISSARLQKNLTREDLACRINERESVVRDLENGLGILTPVLRSKLIGALGVKFPRRSSMIDDEESD